MIVRMVVIAALLAPIVATPGCSSSQKTEEPERVAQVAPPPAGCGCGKKEPPPAPPPPQVIVQKEPCGFDNTVSLPETQVVGTFEVVDEITRVTSLWACGPGGRCLLSQSGGNKTTTNAMSIVVNGSGAVVVKGDVIKGGADCKPTDTPQQAAQPTPAQQSPPPPPSAP